MISTTEHLWQAGASTASTARRDQRSGLGISAANGAAVMAIRGIRRKERRLWRTAWGCLRAHPPRGKNQGLLLAVRCQRIDAAKQSISFLWLRPVCEPPSPTGQAALLFHGSRSPANGARTARALCVWLRNSLGRAMTIRGYCVTLREGRFYRSRYSLRRRQGAGILVAAIDAVFWPDPATPYLSVRFQFPRN